MQLQFIKICNDEMLLVYCINCVRMAFFYFLNVFFIPFAPVKKPCFFQVLENQLKPFYPESTFHFDGFRFKAFYTLFFIIYYVKENIRKDDISSKKSVHKEVNFNF